jgi:Ca2+-binding EF-hand superfamily protein
LGKNQIRKLISDIYCELGLQTLTENQLEGIVKAIDVDEDGDVTFNELIKVLKPILESS